MKPVERLPSSLCWCRREGRPCHPEHNKLDHRVAAAGGHSDDWLCPDDLHPEEQLPAEKAGTAMHPQLWQSTAVNVTAKAGPAPLLPEPCSFFCTAPYVCIHFGNVHGT